MDEFIAQVYELAPRFDEGELFQGEEYGRVKGRQLDLYDLLVDTFGESLAPLLNDYTNTLFEEMELEAQHFFQEGFRAGQLLR